MRSDCLITNGVRVEIQKNHCSASGREQNIFVLLCFVFLKDIVILVNRKLVNKSYVISKSWLSLELHL